MNTLAGPARLALNAPMQLDTPIRLADLARAQLAVELREHRSRAYMRWHSCYKEVGNPDGASRLFLNRYGDGAWGVSEVKTSLATGECKSAVLPGSTVGSDWAAPTVGIGLLAAGFSAVVHSESVFGRLNLQPTPFNTKIPIQSADATYGWVGEGLAMPVGALSLGNGPTLDVRKSGVIIPLTDELVKLTTPGTDITMRTTLVNGLNAFQDRAFLDPTSAAIAGVRPASITYGLTPVASTTNFQADVQKLIDTFYAARPGARWTNTRLIANGAKAYQLRTLQPNGARIEIVDTEAAGNNVVIVDGSGIYYADGGVVLDLSREASLQLNTTPDNPPTAATVPTSLWQNNLVAYKVQRWLNWYAVPNSVQYMVTT